MDKNNFSINFDSDWNWGDLESQCSEEKAKYNLDLLRNTISVEEGRFIFHQLIRLKYPQSIRDLLQYQIMQIEWGGSFYGAIPDSLSEESDLPIPNDFSGLMETALFLAKIRKENRENVERAGFYRLEFSGKTIEELALESKPTSMMSLTLDVSGLQCLLNLLSQEDITFDDALAISNHSAFREMIRHRHDLGYVPEPWVTEESLARFIQRAASREPLDMIWKWLNPWNFFDMADLFFNLDEYKKLIAFLQSNREQMANHVLEKVGQFAPQGIDFRDRFTFTVGWGIRGWATAITSGVNIEHFKDNINHLLRTMIHETFHRLQLQICPVDNSQSKNAHRSFEDLTFRSFPDERDAKFYEIISYIFLEGSATFVDGSTVSEEDAKRGFQLLFQVWKTIYSEKNLDEADRLLNLGLKSNGPFYAMGCYMSRIIVDRFGRDGLSQSLLGGGIAFFKNYSCARKEAIGELMPLVVVLQSEIEATIYAFANSVSQIS